MKFEADLLAMRICTISSKSNSNKTKVLWSSKKCCVPLAVVLAELAVDGHLGHVGEAVLEREGLGRGQVVAGGGHGRGLPVRRLEAGGGGGAEAARAGRRLAAAAQRLGGGPCALAVRRDGHGARPLRSLLLRCLWLGILSGRKAIEINHVREKMSFTHKNEIKTSVQAVVASTTKTKTQIKRKKNKQIKG